MCSQSDRCTWGQTPPHQSSQCMQRTISTSWSTLASATPQPQNHTTSITTPLSPVHIAVPGTMGIVSLLLLALKDYLLGGKGSNKQEPYPAGPRPALWRLLLALVALVLECASLCFSWVLAVAHDFLWPTNWEPPSHTGRTRFMQLTPCAWQPSTHRVASTVKCLMASQYHQWHAACLRPSQCIVPGATAAAVVR
jgi:hypothetical protein